MWSKILDHELLVPALGGLVTASAFSLVDFDPYLMLGGFFTGAFLGFVIDARILDRRGLTPGQTLTTRRKTRR